LRGATVQLCCLAQNDAFVGLIDAAVTLMPVSKSCVFSLLFRKNPNDGQSPKNPISLCVIHYRQNPIVSTCHAFFVCRLWGLVHVEAVDMLLKLSEGSTSSLM
jgi:hypothetical protein